MSITVRSVLLFLFLSVSLFLNPGRVLGQSYIGTSTSMAYGSYNGTNSLAIFGEFFYDNSGSGSYQWAGNAFRFSVTISKYTSHANMANNNAVSTNTTVISCGVGEWAVQQWNSTTARVSGTKYLTLEQGYIHVVSITPQAHGSYRPSFYSMWSGFSWNGTQDSETVDLLHPGDG